LVLVVLNLRILISYVPLLRISAILEAVVAVDSKVSDIRKCGGCREGQNQCED